MKTVFKNCILLDGTKNMAPIEHTDVVTDGDKIVFIGKAEIGAGDRVFDLNGKYLMPGLINLHVHLPAGGKPQKKPLKATLLSRIALSSAVMRNFTLKMCNSYAMQGLMSGVTTIRTVGGLDNIDTKLRDKINSGALEGPRILASDFAIGVPGGHMVGSVARAAETVDDAVRMVDELKTHNVDLIKLMITGGVMDAKVKGEPGRLMMQPDMIKACCDRAHEYGFKVAAHVQSPEGVRCAVQNGVDSIEHGSTLTQKEIDAFKQHGAVMVCTISPALPMAKFDMQTLGITEAVQYNSNIVYNNMIAGSKTALANGITVGLGTDTGCPYTTHYNMWRELHYFGKNVGVSPEFALYTATLNNAAILGIDDITGSIEVGKCADMLISNTNPLDDFRALSNPYMVVARGKVYEQPKIEKYPTCDAELDKYYG
ncbi:MAG TPA: peptidase [Ruminococcaceae bacterium]|nr:MAG: peptidase [Clostridiales bacterium 41_21_two_genomes]HCK43978.1 peptidase [Oscillospiraceae bacterium]